VGGLIHYPLPIQVYRPCRVGGPRAGLVRPPQSIRYYPDPNQVTMFAGGPFPYQKLQSVFAVNQGDNR
jgi:hypothetical protein